MGPRRPGEHLAPGAWFVAIRERFRPERAAGLREAYEFRVDGRVFEVRVEDGTCTTSEGSASRPAAVFTMSADVLDQLVLGQLTAAQAIADGSARVAGDPGTLARFQDLFPPLDIQVAATR